MKPKIHLAVVDDWEVRGNGTGDPRVLQFEPMRRITAIFDRFGIKGSFNVELQQQLAYRRHQDRHPELRAIADEWDNSVRAAFRGGHDIQPHLHPQWSSASYLGDLHWELSGDWSILNYSAPEIRSMIGKSVEYLEQLLQPVRPNYKCLSHRAGSWCLAPSEYLLPILVDFGFILDQSIVAGLRIDTPRVKLDYTVCEEDFLPYYPVLTDARRVSPSQESIVCIPTHTFRGAPMALLGRDVRKLFEKARLRLGRASTQATTGTRGATQGEWTNKEHSGAVGFVRKLMTRYTADQLHISDLSRLNFSMMKVMIADIRKKANETGLPVVPVILENHTKDIIDFSDIERFVELITTSDDIKVVTLAEIANGLQSGEYEVLTSSRLHRKTAEYA